MHKTVKRGRLKSQGPDIRDLMSRNLRDFVLQEPDVRANGRMYGMAGCPGSKSEDELEELDFGGGK